MLCCQFLELAQIDAVTVRRPTPRPIRALRCCPVSTVPGLSGTRSGRYSSGSRSFVFDCRGAVYAVPATMSNAASSVGAARIWGGIRVAGNFWQGAWNRLPAFWGHRAGTRPAPTAAAAFADLGRRVGPQARPSGRAGTWNSNGKVKGKGLIHESARMSTKSGNCWLCQGGVAGESPRTREGRRPDRPEQHWPRVGGQLPAASRARA